MYVTTDLSLFHRYLVKFLRKWCTTHFITMCVTQFLAANTDLLCKSTISNLACYLDSISESIDNKKQVDPVYVDFSKPCDSVCHPPIYSRA